MSGIGALFSPPPEKLYAFSYNILDEKAPHEAVLEYLKAAKHISSWASYTPGLFFFKSSWAAHPLAESLRKIANNVNCVVVEVNANNLGGWLPAASWDWFKDNNPSRQDTTTIDATSLANALLRKP